MDTKSEISYEFVNIKGKNLHVQLIQQEAAANLPYLIFLHEGLGCIDMWKDFPKLLSDELKMNALVYERQGYGKSDSLDLPRPKNYLEIEALEFLPDLLKHYNIIEPILIGHSDGGSIALIYAAHFSPKALVAEAAHVFVEDETIKGIEMARNNPELPQIINKLKKYHGEKAEMLFSAWTDTWLSEEFYDWNISSCLSEILCPVLVIQGKKDEYATSHHVESIISGLKNVVYRESFMPENCAHIPHLQAKEDVLKSMLKFIKNVLA